MGSVRPVVLSKSFPRRLRAWLREGWAPAESATLAPSAASPPASPLPARVGSAAGLSVKPTTLPLASVTVARPGTTGPARLMGAGTGDAGPVSLRDAKPAMHTHMCVRCLNQSRTSVQGTYSSHICAYCRRVYVGSRGSAATKRWSTPSSTKGRVAGVSFARAARRTEHACKHSRRYA